MSFFRFLFNLLWFVLGGVFMGLAWWLAGLLCFISLIGIPWGRACFVIGTFTFFPFGKQAVSRKSMTGQSDIGTGALGLIGNILWFVLIGVWLAIGHIASALACPKRSWMSPGGRCSNTRSPPCPRPHNS